ncbi:MAG: hypothetical protein WED82_11185, partial [Balneolales bacterium]
FKNIVNNCVGIIYPSSAEGGGGCVITAMHAGLIPIVSYQASVDVDDSFGIMLKSNSVEAIKEEIIAISERSHGKLREMSSKAWQVARDRYTRQHYSIQFERMIHETIADIKNKG